MNSILLLYVIVQVYLTCCLLSYLSFKDLIKSTEHKWSRKDRLFGILVSMWGPISFLVGLSDIIKLFENHKIISTISTYFNGEAKW